jgi:hypothetical protein
VKKAVSFCPANTPKGERDPVLRELARLRAMRAKGARPLRIRVKK